MRIRVAHLRTQGIDFAVFETDARNRTTQDRADLLARLTRQLRFNGRRVDKAALAFVENGRTTFFGAPDLTRYLARNGVSRWTHTLDA